MNLLFSSIDAFDNPDSPIYYIVGCIFLLLIFAALAVYLIVSKKRAKKEREKNSVTPNENDTATDVPSADSAEQEEKSENAEVNAVENSETDGTVSAQQQKDIGSEKSGENSIADADRKEEVSSVDTAENDNKTTADEEKHQTDAAAAKTPQKKPSPKKSNSANKAAAEVIEDTQKTEQKTETEHTKKPPQTKKTTTKKTQKSFIDRLIEEKTVHSVYNELKNTVLSYPGIKSKLTKDNEQFFFGENAMASIVLNGSAVELYLNIDNEKMPTMFGSKKSDANLPTKLDVAESNIDNAQKAITFAMNVSMLTRNERHRYVDYVQKAVDAKNRAKSKSKK